MMNNQESIVARLEAIEAKLAAFGSDAPLIRLKTDEAQIGSGAENREPII